ncbi:hypothetical protein [Streptomyces tsukubensis]|uniref:hypothetical protein n=1 Tax=Streptomyces tsukubensis TaxID=83656 RepID=UPI00344CF396
MNDPVPLSVLTLTTVPASPHAWQEWAEVRPFIDGRDVLAEIHPDGVSGCSRWDWFGPAGSWPLTASAEPRRVALSNNDCEPECCGGVFVTVGRRGDRVVWSSWENSDNDRAALPVEVHFDAVRYDAALARVVEDTDWEEPLDTVARLMQQEFMDNGWFERWGCVLSGTAPRRRSGTYSVGVHFSHRRGQSPARFFFYELPVDARQPAAEQARRHLATIMSGDPRTTAKRQGG